MEISTIVRYNKNIYLLRKRFILSIEQTIIGNEQDIDRHINHLEMNVESLSKENKKIRELVEYINAVVCKSAKRFIKWR